jgi:hypothetical protein
MYKKIILGAVLFCAVTFLMPLAAHAAYYSGTLDSGNIGSTMNAGTISGSITPVTYNAGWTGNNGVYYPVPATTYYNWSTNQFTTPPSVSPYLNTYTNMYANTYSNSYANSYSYNSAYNYNNNYSNSYNYSNYSAPYVSPTTYSSYGTSASYSNCNSCYNCHTCPDGYVNYGVPLGCVPASYITYCHTHPMQCPLGPIRY